LLRAFLKHRVEVITRRTRFDLIKAEERQHLLTGLKIALANINEVVETIKASKNPAFAKEELIKRFSLSEVQSNAILEMRLQRLTSMEQEKLSQEMEELTLAIRNYREILGKEEKVYSIIKEEFTQLKKDFSDARKTEIVDMQADIPLEELIKDELFVLTLSQEGYIKRSLASIYQKQNRGGKGKMGMATKEEDNVDRLVVASSLDSVLFFSSLGKIYWKKVYELPEASRTAKGRAMVNVLPLEAEEKIVSWMCFDDKNENFWQTHSLVILTAFGTIKKTMLEEYKSKRSLGMKAIVLDENDSVVKVQLVDKDSFLFVASKLGMATVFNENELRAQGRVTRGVRGIRLKKRGTKQDVCVSLETVTLEDSILTVSENGYGKRSKISAYRVGKRGNMGVLNMRVTDKTGPIVASLKCKESDELILITDHAFVVRLSIKQISEIGRVTQGVKLISLQGKDKVASLSLVPEWEEQETEMPLEKGNPLEN